MINPIDELRHRATSADKNWSESYYFSFSDIASRISGFFRIGLEENARKSNIWCALFHEGKVVYQRFQFNLPYTDAGIENVEVDGLRFSMVELMRVFEISFHDRKLAVDLRWQGLHDVVDMHEAMGKLSAAVANGHHEQSGCVAGRITIDGRQVAVDGFGFRDHSWGARNWEGVKSWKTCAGQFGQDFAFHAAEINELSGESFYLGLIYENGKIVPVEKIEITVDDLVSPREALLTFEHKSGEKTLIEITYNPKAICHIPRDFNVIQECYVSLRMGDRLGVGFSEINRALLFC